MKTLLMILSALLILGCAEPKQPEIQPPQEQVVEVVPPVIIKPNPTPDTPAQGTPPEEEVVIEQDDEVAEEEPVVEPEQIVEEETEPVVEPADEIVVADPVVDPVEETPPSEPEPIPQYSGNLLIFASSSTGNKFYDTDQWLDTTYEKRAGANIYTAGFEIHTLDHSGNSINMLYAPESGDVIKQTNTGYVLCDIMQADESQSLGAMPRIHSQIHVYDGTAWSEPNHWSANQWECSKVIKSETGVVVIKDTMGTVHPMGAETNIHSINDGGILAYNQDSANKTVTFSTAEGNTQEFWVTNNFLNAKEWVKLGDSYYSHNGYEYSFLGGLGRLTTAMSEFNTFPYAVGLDLNERPILIPVGVNGQSVYWIECNSGHLIQYSPATNQILLDKRLYIGSGIRSDGNVLAKTLKPYMGNNWVYFSYLGATSKISLVDGSVRVVLNGDYSILSY